MALNPSTLPTRLREATKASHHAIDHHPALAPMVRSELTRDHYIDVLRAMTWIYRTLDPALAEALRHHCPGDAYRCSERTSWLAKDLAYFHRDGPLPPPWHPPVIESAPALVGRIYAVEGSTLGGQVIANCLAGSLRVGSNTGGRMFHGHGPSTRDRWVEFQAFAARACPHPDIETACDAANKMFAELGRLLDQWPWGCETGRCLR